VSHDTSQLTAAKKAFDSWRMDLMRRKGARDSLLDVREKEQASCAQHREDAQLSNQAHLFMLSEINERRQTAITAIEEMGSSALHLVYGECYRLKFNAYDEKRGTGTYKMDILIGSPHEGKELLTGLIGERGGGVVEIVSFALRIAALNWCGYEGPLILDEAYKSMSADEKIEAVARFLRHVCDMMGRQLIFATHKLEVFGPLADHIVHVTNSDGLATVTSISPSSVVPGNIGGSGPI
jgi:hypothetical protein